MNQLAMHGVAVSGFEMASAYGGTFLGPFFSFMCLFFFFSHGLQYFFFFFCGLDDSSKRPCASSPLLCSKRDHLRRRQPYCEHVPFRSWAVPFFSFLLRADAQQLKSNPGASLAARVQSIHQLEHAAGLDQFVPGSRSVCSQPLSTDPLYNTHRKELAQR